MPKQLHILKNFSGGLNSLSDSRDIKENELSQSDQAMVDQGIIRTNSTATTDKDSRSAITAPGHGLYIYGTDHTSGSSAPKTGSDWIASADAFTAQVDLFEKYVSASVGAIDLGTVNSYQPGSGKLDFPTTSTITDSDAGFISTAKLKVGDIILTSGCTTETANNQNGNIITAVAAGTVTVNGTPFTVEAEEAGKPIITVLSKMVYHFADEALRVADGSLSASTKPKWYGYVDRQHFSGLDPGGASANTYDNWFQSDNDLLAPSIGLVGTGIGGDFGSAANWNIADDIDNSDTNSLVTSASNFPIAWSNLTSFKCVKVTALDDAGSSEIVDILAHDSATEITTDVLSGGVEWDFEKYGIFPTAGNGFNVDLTLTNEEGTWVAGTYEFACTFIYDGNQESLPYTMTGTVAIAANDSVEALVYAMAPYNERISGGRIYYRDSTSKGEWQFLVDISLNSGARNALSGDYTAWSETYSDSLAVYTSTTIDNQSLETYETINGFASDVTSINIGQNGDGYTTSIVANNRTFIANVSMTDEDGNSNARFRDRIVYSPNGKYDTFPTNYFIDVVQGDSEEYVKLEEFDGRLLAFKQKTLYIIDINAPNPANWFLEQKIPFHGITQPTQAMRTAFGVIWFNVHGAYLYDGGKITNILGEKIDRDAWESFHTNYGAIMYIPQQQYMVFLDDITAPSGTATQYVFSLINNSWTTWKTSTESTKLSPTKLYSNFVTNWDNKVVGSLATSKAVDTTVIFEYEEGTVEVAQNSFDVRSGDIDFGSPGQLKKIYKVIVTYKADSAQTIPASGALNGSTSFANFAGDFSNDTGVWDVATFTTTPFTCQSFRFRFRNTTDSVDLSIGDISIEYRLLPYSRVT